jgi:hypothetical protein
MTCKIKQLSRTVSLSKSQKLLGAKGFFSTKSGNCYCSCAGDTGQTGEVHRLDRCRPKGQTGHGLKNPDMSKSGHPEVDGGKDRVKHNGKKLKLTFAELLAKYQKDNEAKRANWSNDIKYSRLPPRRNYGNWNRQRKGFHSATTYSPFEPSMPVSYAPYCSIFH